MLTPKPYACLIASTGNATVRGLSMMAFSGLIVTDESSMTIAAAADAEWLLVVTATAH